ncbi:MAG: hypothetical protein KDA24_20795 [Deltaproteobacteria bacterium]|nr:hypothetical protein [Deltaproteobacteria bacterium]
MSSPSAPTVQEHAKNPPESGIAVAHSYLPSSRLERWMVGRAHWPMALGIVLLTSAALGLALFLDGLLEAPASTTAAGTTGLTTESVYLIQMPFTIGYMVLAFPYLRRWLDRVIVALRPIVSLPEPEFVAFIAELDERNKTTQKRFTTGYVLASFLVLWGWDAEYPATSAFWLFSMGFASVCIGYLVAMVPLFARLLLRELLDRADDYNIFNPLPLHTVADFSLRVTVVLVGAIVIGELLVEVEEAMSVAHLTVNGLLVAFALALHFFMLLGAHQLMVDRKEEELAVVATRLQAAYRRVNETLERGEEVSEDLDYTINSLSTLEARIGECPEWPQNPEEVAKLISTAAIPAAMTLGKSLAAKVATG